VISVIIPVKNGGADLGRCLDAIGRQRVEQPVEIVVADTGSTDETVEIARSRRARVLELPSAGFRHGATRNTAAEHARGDILVFTVQDAYAADRDWLARLSGWLVAAEGIAGVYGRQIPHEGASPPELFFLDFLYGREPRVQRVGGADELSLKTTLFSNVNSAIPRAVWSEFPFADDVFFAEDQDWCRRVLLAGYEVRYDPAAAVCHSHSYNLATAFKRFFDSGASAERGYLAGGSSSSRVLAREALRYARDELAWLVRTGRSRSIPYAAAYELAKFLGVQTGARHRLLPLWLKRRWSFYPDYWEEQAAGGPAEGGDAQAASAQKTNAASESTPDSR
jgi:rhamnosyltransferase